MINEIKILDLDLKLNILRLKLGLLKLLADHIIIVQKKNNFKTSRSKWAVHLLCPKGVDLRIMCWYLNADKIVQIDSELILKCK